MSQIYNRTPHVAIFHMGSKILHTYWGGGGGGVAISQSIITKIGGTLEEFYENLGKLVHYIIRL